MPRGTHHWFDLCAERRIRAIRLFQDPSGWTPHYTDSGIDRGFQPLCFGPAYVGPAAQPHRVTACAAQASRVVLLDIEGTTTPLSFVHDVLFPYARAHVCRLGRESRSPDDPELREIAAAHPRRSRCRGGRLGAAAAVGGRCADLSQPTAASACCSVSPPWTRIESRPALKTVQGLVWLQGYQDGSLAGQVYPDVSRRSRDGPPRGRQVGIYSSGSVLAQKLLFASSNAGDLTPFLRWHFDTAVGAKIEMESYRRIVSEVGASPSKVLFISDVSRELDAARAAGLMTRLCARGDRPPVSHPLITSFDQVP